MNYELARKQTQLEGAQRGLWAEGEWLACVVFGFAAGLVSGLEGMFFPQELRRRSVLGG